MSIEARTAIVNAPGTKFQNNSQRADFLDPNLTDSDLVALVQHVLDGGFALEFTAVRSDHHDDGPNGHAGGLAFDCWPLASETAGDYLDENDSKFADFLKRVASFPGLYQVGLAGTAYTDANLLAIGLKQDFGSDPCVFEDEGADHIHCGVHPA